MTNLDLSSPQEIQKIKLTDVEEILRNEVFYGGGEFHHNTIDHAIYQTEVTQAALRWIFTTLHSYGIIYVGNLMALEMILNTNCLCKTEKTFSSRRITRWVFK